MLRNDELLKGAALGLGIAVLIPVAVIVLAPVVRPVARSIVKSGMLAFEKSREAIAELGEVLEDVPDSGLTIVEAVKRYSILTVGDGLVSQIPALIIATASGMLVTKAGVKGLHGSVDQLGGGEVGGEDVADRACDGRAHSVEPARAGGGERLRFAQQARPWSHQDGPRHRLHGAAHDGAQGDQARRVP